MSLTTKGAVLLTAPALASVTDDARWTQKLADADAQVSLEVFPLDVGGINYAELAARYLVAHTLTLEERVKSGASGPITNVRVGDVSTTFASPYASKAAWEAWLLGTEFGQKFLDLSRPATAGGFVL